MNPNFEHRSIQRRYAFMLALTYLVVTCLWIKFSNRWLEGLAGGSIRRLEFLHLIKAFGFMTVTSIGFYFSMDWVSRKVARTTHQLHQTQESWLEAERKAAPALLASCIGHDVANLLTVIRLNLERLKRMDQLPVLAIETVGKLDNGTDRLMELVKRLRGAGSSLFQEDPTHFDFSRVVEDTVSLMRSHACCEKVSIDFQPLPGLMLSGYPVLVHQIVMNLMINAAEATDQARIRFKVGPLDSAGVFLSVEDNGPGIAPRLREKVMSAFFTTKAAGSGLGLTSVRSCVDIHKGTMEIADSKDLGGARFWIALPDLNRARAEELRRPEATARPSLEINHLH